jgi:hypothetical protein
MYTHHITANALSVRCVHYLGPVLCKGHTKKYNLYTITKWHGMDWIDQAQDTDQ